VPGPLPWVMLLRPCVVSWTVAPVAAAAVGGADRPSRCYDDSMGDLAESGDKMVAAAVGAGAAAPQQQFAICGEGSTDLVQACGVRGDVFARQRAGREAHFTRGAVRDHMDRAQAVMRRWHPRNLKRRRRCCVEPDRDDFRPQARDQRLDVVDGGVDEGDFMDKVRGVAVNRKGYWEATTWPQGGA
jgi:hypothetical protein